ncbi:acyl-CoA dehydrogenase family protein [Rhodococcus koreensis]
MTTIEETTQSPTADEIGLLRDSLRAWLDRHLSRERVRELDEARTVPVDLWRGLAELGVTGLRFGEEYGGSSADVRYDYTVIEELGRRYASMAAGYMVVSMAGKFVSMHGNDEQRQRLLPGLAAGDALISFGLTEPDTGTDLAAIKTRATLRDGQWHLSGQKLYITLAADAKTLIVLARTDEPTEGRNSNGLSLILVPRDQPGVNVRRLKMAGLRAAGTTEIFFDDALAPEDAIIGTRGKGLEALLGTLNHERILQAYMAVGIAEAAWTDARDYALQRTAFGRPIGSFQAVQHPLAESYVELAGAKHLNEEAAAIEATGGNCVLEAAVAKHAAGEAAVNATDRALRIQAGYGLTEESDLMRFHRDARDMVSGPVSNEMARNIIAERCGLPRSY